MTDTPTPTRDEMKLWFDALFYASLLKKSAQAERMYHAIHDELSTPSGWQLVPVEPTEDMKMVGDELLDDTLECSHNVYNAMLSAAPLPPRRNEK